MTFTFLFFLSIISHSRITITFSAGDRIVGVTVSFAAMVYEDALTILSYASPYDVRLEIEKAPATSTVSLPSCSPKRLGASTSFRNNEQRRLFHPLYRSQSIDDLTQIGKDGFGLINTSGRWINKAY